MRSDAGDLPDVTERAEQHLDGKKDFSQQLWALLTLETWLSKDRA